MATDKSVLAVIRASRPTFRNSYDKVAFAVHAFFLASGYKLIATGPSALLESDVSSTSDEVGIDHWNELDEEYAFVYANDENVSKKVLIKCLVMNDILAVDVLLRGSAELAHLEINVREYSTESEASYATQFKNLDRLASQLNAEILSKLDGFSSTSSHDRPPCSQTLEQEGHPYPEVGPFAEDHHQGPTNPPGFIVPPISPIGGSDLFPGPGAGMYPTRGNFGGEGSMLVGPGDPRWFGGRVDDPNMDTRQLVPPGARFDPYGPPGVPGFEPSRFTRFPRRPGGRGTHPDLQHFRDGSDFI